jgi:hypothetical protein
VISEILETHHLYLLGGDLAMEIYGGRSIETVLDYVRAFQKKAKTREVKKGKASKRSFEMRQRVSLGYEILLG